MVVMRLFCKVCLRENSVFSPLPSVCNCWQCVAKCIFLSSFVYTKFLLHDIELTFLVVVSLNVLGHENSKFKRLLRLWWIVNTSLSTFSSLPFVGYIARTKHHLPGRLVCQPGGLHAAVGRLHLWLFHDLVFWKPVQWSWVQPFHTWIFFSVTLEV